MLDNKALYQQILQFTEDEIKGLTNNQEYPVFKTQEDYVDPGDYPTPEPPTPSPSATPTPTPQPIPCICDSNSGWFSEIPENNPTDQQIQSFKNAILSHNKTVEAWFVSFNKFLTQSDAAKTNINKSINEVEDQKKEIQEMVDIIQKRKPLECDIIKNSKRIKQLNEDIDLYFRSMTTIGNQYMSDMKELKITPSKPTVNSPGKNFEHASRCYETLGAVCVGSGYNKDLFRDNLFNLRFKELMEKLISGFKEYKKQWSLWKNAKLEKLNLVFDNARLRKEINDLDKKFGLVSLFKIQSKAQEIKKAIEKVKTSIQEYNTKFGPAIEQLSTEKDNINANAVNIAESLPELQTVYNELENLETICPINGTKFVCYKYETIQQVIDFSEISRADIGLVATTLEKINPPVFNSPVVVVDKCV